MCFFRHARGVASTRFEEREKPPPRDAGDDRAPSGTQSAGRKNTRAQANSPEPTKGPHVGLVPRGSAKVRKGEIVGFR